MELENLLVDQEALVKQMVEVSLKSKKEALFSGQHKNRPRRRFLRIEIMKIEKMKRALKMEELEEVATIMIDDPWVAKIIMSSVSSVEK